MKFKLSFLLLAMLFISCQEKHKSTHVENTKTAIETSLWLDYSKASTTFKLWSPTAELVKLNLYKNGFEGEPFETHELTPSMNEVWTKKNK